MENVLLLFAVFVSFTFFVFLFRSIVRTDGVRVALCAMAGAAAVVGTAVLVVYIVQNL